MYDFYVLNIVPQAKKDLKNLYAAIPETEGCSKNIVLENGCGAWCCLSPDTLVYTAFGPVPIKDIEIGISVMTKSGWHRVIRSGSRHISQDIVKVTTCYGREMVLTHDHRVYAEYVKRVDRHVLATPLFVNAGELKSKNREHGGHFIIFPKASWKHDAGGVAILDILEYMPFATSCAENGYDYVYASHRKRGSKLPRQIVMDRKFVNIIGLFLAEGSFDDSQINFHFHEDEVHLHQQVKDFAIEFGLRCSWRVTHGKSFTMRIFSRVLNSLFKSLCGEYCDNKRIHPRLLNLIQTSKSLTQALHDGLYAGDKGRKSLEKGTYSYSTTSPRLASQMIFINHLLGRFVGVCKSIPLFKKPYWTLTDNQSGKYKDYIETPDEWRVPVRNVEVISYSGLVYDIEIDGEESFLTDAGEVHNCKYQSPSAFYVEFLYAWNHIISTWPKAKIYDLIIEAVRNVISDATTKGCVCWNSQTKMCNIHEHRCFNCRIYGQTPEEEFKPRYEKLKVLYADKDDAVVRDQCNLVTTVGPIPSTEDINEWFNILLLAEHDIGIPPNLAHDGDGGTYRTYHDHIILKIGTPAFLNKLMEMRQMPDKDKKELFIEALSKQLKSGAIKL